MASSLALKAKLKTQETLSEQLTGQEIGALLCSLKKNRLLEPTYIEEELIEQTTKILKQLSVVESSLQDESSFVPAEESLP